MIVEKLKDLLHTHFPDLINRVILFGSRITVKAAEYSDYDILIITNQPCDWQLKKRIHDICWELDYEFDILTDVKIISVKDLHTIKGKQPFIINALEQGYAV